MTRRPLIVGVTGGIGSGKSAAVDEFVRRGAAAFSADQAVHQLYRTEPVRAAVIARWGPEVCALTGEIDRARIAAIVFSDPTELQWLEDLLHPRVAEAWESWVSNQRNLANPPRMLVAEVPLLFEAGLEHRYDAVVLVTAPTEIRMQRVHDRGGHAADVSVRGGTQLPASATTSRATCVIDNDGTREQLADKVGAVMDELLGDG